MTVLEDELGDIVAKARQGKGLTISGLAELTGLTAEDIASIESYKSVASDDELRTIAEPLGLNADKLSHIATGLWPPDAPSLPDDDVVVELVVVPHGEFTENCYVASIGTEAMVIDPGGSVDGIRKRLLDRLLNLEIVLLTHAHSDHIGGVEELTRAWPHARVACSRAEFKSIEPAPSARWWNAEDGVEIPFARTSVKALHTPGHTEGSTCYYINGVCFVGDTLFAGSIGRPMSPEHYEGMLESIRSKVLSLPDDTILLPGHGPATTVEQEKAHNPFF